MPAVLGTDDHQRWTAWVPASSDVVRRAVPVLVVRLVTGCGLDEAADLLGVPPGSAAGAVYRMTGTVRALGDGARLRETVADIAGTWARDPTRPDFAARRTALTDWTIPESDWRVLSAAETSREQARRQTGKRMDWPAWRLPASVLLWEVVTSGEASNCPLLRLDHDLGGLVVCGGGINKGVSLLRRKVRREPDGFSANLAAYGSELARYIDSGDSCRSTLANYLVFDHESCVASTSRKSA